ncbi:hypothetical protein BGX38DRAFT_1142724 [Terfezia claveryi]|nr:hypothetical protein BGX38DRAFT_1142724 [Terfezia claveryi]
MPPDSPTLHHRTVYFQTPQWQNSPFIHPGQHSMSHLGRLKRIPPNLVPGLVGQLQGRILVKTLYYPNLIPNYYQPAPSHNPSPTIPVGTGPVSRWSAFARILYFILFIAALAPATLTWLLPIKIRDWEFENACL